MIQAQLKYASQYEVNTLLMKEEEVQQKNKCDAQQSNQSKQKQKKRCFNECKTLGTRIGTVCKKEYVICVKYLQAM